MSDLSPMFAKEPTAAKLLDMSRAEFGRLVAAGSLPASNPFGRWDVAELAAIMRGETARVSQGLDL
jgi:hypothetical protein